ncbi:MAG TPA: ParB/RepB/Spo0J family partition protein [Segeticoccus sp.]|nr:ParB/RepB/Spo0J family partition protein [Segeticoccus sp.]
MSEKRRGLGRGLGALIPSAPATGSDRPTDVFFKDSSARPDPTATDPLAVPTARHSTSSDGDDGGRTSPATPEQPQDADPGRFTGNTTPADPTAPSDTAVPSDPTAPSDPAVPSDTAVPTNESPDNAAETRARGESDNTHGDTGRFTGHHSHAERSASSDDRDRDQAETAASARTTTDEAATARTGSDTSASDASGTDASGTDASAGAAQHDDDRAGSDPVDSSGFTGNKRTPANTENVSHVPDGELAPVPGATFAEVPLGDIRPNARQPRTVFDEDELSELVHSIREIGVLQPVVVRPVAPADQGEAARYELIMGERRWRAAGEAGLATIPAIVKDTHDDDMLRDALLENLHRSQLNPLEEAAAYQQLLDDFGCTHDELATRIGRSRPQISNTLRLLKLPPLVARRVAAGVLSAGHARALLGLADAASMERMAQRIVAEGLSVRTVEEIIALGVDDEPRVRARSPRAGNRHPQLDDLAARLSDRFDTRVNVALGKRKGKLTVEFASMDDLNRILSVLAPDEDVAG